MRESNCFYIDTDENIRVVQEVFDTIMYSQSINARPSKIVESYINNSVIIHGTSAYLALCLLLRRNYGGLSIGEFYLVDTFVYELYDESTKQHDPFDLKDKKANLIRIKELNENLSKLTNTILFSELFLLYEKNGEDVDQSIKEARNLFQISKKNA